MIFWIVAAILCTTTRYKSIILIFIASASMLILSGVPWRYILLLLVLALMFGVLRFQNHICLNVLQLFFFFLNPSSDLQGSSFQLQQSLIGIGSGDIWKRFGAKFAKKKFTYRQNHKEIRYLPLWAKSLVLSAQRLLLFFLIFGLRGMRIAYRAPDSFGRLMVAGLYMHFY